VLQYWKVQRKRYGLRPFGYRAGHLLLAPPHVEHFVVAVLTMMAHLDIAVGVRRHVNYVPPHVGASWHTSSSLLKLAG